MNGLDALRQRAGGVEPGGAAIPTPINESNVNPPDTPAWQTASEKPPAPGDPSLNSSSKPFEGPFFEAPHPPVASYLPAPVRSNTDLKKFSAAAEYRPEYAQMMLDFFESVEKNTEIPETITWRDGREREVLKLRPNAPPMFSEFARTLGVSERKLKSWTREHAEFREAYEICASIVKEFIVENGLLGNYPSQFAIFAGKNLTDMKDKIIEERRTLDVNKLLDDIDSGKYGDGSRYESLE